MFHVHYKKMATATKRIKLSDERSDEKFHDLSLFHIFEFLDSFDLLKNCLLVSKQWKDITTSVKLSLRLPTPYHMKILTQCNYLNNLSCLTVGDFTTLPASNSFKQLQYLKITDGLLEVPDCL